MRAVETQKTSKTEQSFGKGVAWLASANILVKAFAFVAGIFTARFLMPDDFGIISMAATVTGFVEYLSNMGVEAFLISRKDIDTKKINTVYLLNIILGIIFALITIAIAFPAAAFYKTPEVKTVLFVAGFTFIVAAFCSIPRVVLLKDMQQSLIAKIQISNGFSRSVLIILFSVLGFKYLSYAVPMLISFIISTALYIYFSKWKYSLEFDFSILKELLNYSKKYIPKSILTYFIMNADYVIVGYLLGKEILGYYYFGFEKAVLILMILSNIGINAYMPLFSKNQSDKEALLNSFFSVAKKQAFILYPMFFLQIILAKELITFLYGSKWLDSILPFQLLVGIMFARCINIIISNFFDAIGKPGENLKICLINSPLLVIFFYFGAKMGGLLGISIAAFIAHNIAVYLFFIQFSRVMKINLSSVYKVYFDTFIPLLIMLPVILPIKWGLLHFNSPKLLTISVISLISVFLYLFSSKYLMKEMYTEVFLSFKMKLINKISNK